MKEYSVVLKLSIETTNTMSLDDVNDFTEDLIENIKKESTKKINVINVDVEDVEDLNEELYGFDEVDYE